MPRSSDEKGEPAGGNATEQRPSAKDRLLTGDVLAAVVAILKLDLNDAQKMKTLVSEARIIEDAVMAIKLRPRTGQYEAVIQRLDTMKSLLDRQFELLGIHPEEERDRESLPTQLFPIITGRLAERSRTSRNRNKLDYRAAERELRRVLTAMRRLRLAVVDAEAVFLNTASYGDPLHSRADPALHEAIDRLLALYKLLTNREPGASYSSTGTAVGPTIRFLQEVLPALGWKRSADSLRRLIKQSKARGHIARHMNAGRLRAAPR